MVRISDKGEIEVTSYDLKPPLNWIGEIIDITKINGEENSYTIRMI